MLESVSGVMLKRLTDEDRGRLKKKLRDRYVRKYGYNRKVVIDDILQDFVTLRTHEPDDFAARKLDAYVKRRLTGIMSSDMLKFSHVQIVKAKEIERQKAEKEEVRKRQFSRDCECDKDPELLRSMHRPLSWRPRSPNRAGDPQNARPDYGPDGVRPAGFNRKPHYERKQ